MALVRYDVWGGESHMDHVARRHFDEDATTWAAEAHVDMAKGFLVNLRFLEDGEGWGPDQDFDLRPRAN